MCENELDCFVSLKNRQLKLIYEVEDSGSNFGLNFNSNSRFFILVSMIVKNIKFTFTKLFVSNRVMAKNVILIIGCWSNHWSLEEFRIRKPRNIIDKRPRNPPFWRNWTYWYLLRGNAKVRFRFSPNRIIIFWSVDDAVLWVFRNAIFETTWKLSWA